MNTTDYAGNEKQAISGIKAKITSGRIRYRVHQISGNRWLPWVICSDSYSDYAGNLGKPVDKLQMELLDCPGYEIMYRTSETKSSGYFSWVKGYNNTNSAGYAGVAGKPIDKLQIKIFKK